MANTQKSNTTKSRIKMSSIKKSHNALNPPPHPFLDLPYDIRATIYEQIDALPPFSTSIEYAGFLLSCSQAKEEIHSFSATRYAKFLREFAQEFETDTGHAVTMSSEGGVSAARSLSHTPLRHLLPAPGQRTARQRPEQATSAHGAVSG
jgi:hypothetical protein